jgi:hypothetical protein
MNISTSHGCGERMVGASREEGESRLLDMKKESKKCKRRRANECMDNDR